MPGSRTREMTAATPIRVLVADNHPLYREAVASSVRACADLELVAQAADGREALDAIRAQQPDVVVLDVKMPQVDGMGVLEVIASERSATKVLFLSAYLDS